jgi:hypothetical protein
MRRESHRCAALAVVALAVAACTSGDAESTTTVPEMATTAIETTMTTAPPTTTTTEATTTTALSANTDRVGSPEALSVLVDEAVAFSALAYDEEVDRSVVPDLTGLDAVTATTAIFDFEAVITTLAPATRWVDVFVYPGSPAYGEYLRSFSGLEENGLRAEIGGDGYRVEESRVATDDEAATIPQEILNGAPAGSVVVRISTSSGPIRFVDPDGEVASSSDGWTTRSRNVVLSPTDSGWKLFWTEAV